MFLKRIELNGFKSFANRTILQFDQPLTGIVGPNGCGKSNITDAIRFVLGEQSAKSLRSGSSLNELIFAGSETRKPVNLAKVTLVFDNSQKIFDSPYDEIEISRTITRGSSDIVNTINKTNCRLKDIQDLVMDTGLGRDSLSIISQGNISSFADARPEERRLLFEEAAGVAKYKKRKKISLGKLENVKANLDRAADLLENSEKQLAVLEKQAAKAKEYFKAKEELSAIEISVLATQVRENKTKEDGLKERLNEKKTEELRQSAEGSKADERLNTLQEELLQCDALLSSLQSDLSKAMEQSVSLQKQKAILDERRKIALDSEDQDERRQSLLELFSEARFEYEDRRKRLGAATVETRNLESQLDGQRSAILSLQRTLEQETASLHSLENRLAGVESRLAHPPYRNQGVQAVMRQRQRLHGICGLVSDLLECEDEYMPAISTALASAAEQIVVEREEDARRAIGWLKKTGAGRATFLPLSVCRPRSLADWQKKAAFGVSGILGTADQFVQCEPRFDALRSRLLEGILVASDLEAANTAARALKQSVKIVTLGGDVVHAGGAMTGGSFRQQTNPIPALRKEKAQLLEDIESRQQRIGDLRERLSVMMRDNDQNERRLLQMKIDQEKLSGFVSLKQEKLASLQSQIAALDLQSEAREHEGKAGDEELVSAISALHEKTDTLRSSIQVEQEKKAALQNEISDLNTTLRISRREISSLTAEIARLEQDLIRIQTLLEQDLLRLSQDYSLTYEAAVERMHEVDLKSARSEVTTLRKKISSLGSVNLEAPEQLKEAKEQYEFLSGQVKELEDASKQILTAVDEMDQTMIEKFTDMFGKINDALDEVFVAMFGGGHAKLSLTDPDNLLESGVEVDVQPPGKSVKNMQTFSGGEKALIAISVLFAILKARTVPLCIFDEVEAALDQANVERFARYLSRFKDQSQFIAVTHRPGTMEQCDTLFGITMQKDGVSQVLKVELKDAKEAFGTKTAD
ncbi:AAA family ATPase [Allobaculum mucilyticum]|uniref:AAA family ATPase n=1 Tax=Allobaculum mucilyticum TaxID=2834459 RepID=UPI001E2FFDB9|nr:AAA family ATPase [Allobaculum mucilyticum]UNT95763.1 AAA family ATPase [Allobaculum mucilyticum]